MPLSATDEDVIDIARAHLAFARQSTPPEELFALEPTALSDVTMTVGGVRVEGELVGIGVLRDLGDLTGELKTIHTRESWRGRGVGAEVVKWLVELARQRGYTRVYLETGAWHEFAPARRLYERLGFSPCGPFGDYPDLARSAFYVVDLFT